MAATTVQVIPQLRIAFTAESMARAQADLAGVRNGMPRAVAGAINKLLPKTRTRVTRELGSVVTAKPNNIRSRIKVSSRATPQRLSGSVDILLRQIAAINFQHKEKRKKKGWGTKASGTGVEVKFLKNGPSLHLPHAFVATGKRDQAGGLGNRHIFQRVSGASGKLVARFPIVSIRGLSLMKVFEADVGMQRRVRDYIDGEASKELESQVNRLLKRPRATPNG